MKKKLAYVMILVLFLSLLGCGESVPKAGTKNEGEVSASEEDTEVRENPSIETKETFTSTAIENQDLQQRKALEQHSEDRLDVLVVVFSATGTTKGVAEKIASIEGADLYEITAAQPYSDADLNWNDSSSRTTKEQNDKSVRPEIGSETIDLSGYSKIYVGYPIWWGEEPRIMDTFVESYDFGDATVIPFCTSSSSGIGRSGSNLADNAGSGNWLDGSRFSGSVSEDELRSWIEGLH